VLGTTALALAGLHWFDRWRRPGAVIPISAEYAVAPMIRFRWWLPLVSVAIVLAVVSPWIGMMEARTPGYVFNTIWQEVVVRAKKPQEGHSGPPGFYLLTMLGTLMPWSLMMPAAIVCALRHRKDETVRFALAAFVGPWLMFELVQTKLPHYILPTFPFLAYLLADAICRCAKGQIYDLSDRAFTAAAKAFAVLLGMMALVPMAGAFVEQRYMGSTALLLPAGLLAVVGGVWAVFVWRYFARRELVAATVVLAVGFATVVLTAYSIYLPRASFMQLPRRVAAELARVGVAGDGARPGQVVMIDFKEPSLAFYQGGSIREAADDYLVKSKTQAPWVVLTEEVYHSIPADVAARLEVVSSLHGWAYADGGRWVSVLIAKNRNGEPR
jgi:4-amino-4-deoxy-L-arabinose transferase-like glycosyltransferase